MLFGFCHPVYIYKCIPCHFECYFADNNIDSKYSLDQRNIYDLCKHYIFKCKILVNIFFILNRGFFKSNTMQLDGVISTCKRKCVPSSIWTEIFGASVCNTTYRCCWLKLHTNKVEYQKINYICFWIHFFYVMFGGCLPFTRIIMSSSIWRRTFQVVW